MFPFLYRVASASARTVPFQRGKLASSFAGRRASVSRWIEWASLNRTKSPLIWVHGASVGESLSATAVVTRLRSAVPGLQVVHSYTSPSATPWRETFDGCRADFLPPEEPDTIARVLAAMRPNLIAFSRGDIWPVLTRTAAASGIPIAVIGGTVNPSSLRLWPLIRSTLTPTYRLVDWLGAVSRGDADRWSAIGVSAQSIDVTGDPRHDQVLEHHTNIGSISSLFQWCGESPVLVAGSTDKRDEEILLSALPRSCVPTLAVLV
jgi:3-deoxy-D-manno-octulosonic-acid transferase